MKQLIVQGLQQAYQNLVHMISVFLPRLVAMLLIMLVGLFVALALKYLLRLNLALHPAQSLVGTIRRVAGAAQCGSADDQ